MSQIGRHVHVADADVGRRAHGGDTAVLGLAVDLGHREAEPVEPAQQVGVDRRGGRHEVVGLVEAQFGADRAPDEGVEGPVLGGLDHRQRRSGAGDAALAGRQVEVALGQHLGGYFANRDALATQVDRASQVSGEEVWRMPLFAGYEDKLASTVADADNGPGGPGAITAALFLQHFVGGLPWLHLDVASIGDAPEERFEWTKGPTGFGARLLLTWLGSDDPLQGIRVE